MGDGRGPRLPRCRPLSTALVLGAGGTVGLAYHAGALRALEEVGGFVPDSADLVVGTSAGSVVGAYLRSGWTTAQLWELALSGVDLPPAPTGEGPGRAAGAGEAGPARPSQDDHAEDDHAEDDHSEETQGGGGQGGAIALPELFARAFSTPLELARRSMGSAFVVGRSVVRTPLLPLPAPIRRAFPGGMFEMAEGRSRFESELPTEWPDRPLWLCAVDIVSGRRVVLGRRRPSLGLPQGVMASCAIPGVYPPVRYGRRELIDGGAHSTTNLDLAVRFGADVAIAIVPMGYDPADAPGCPGRLIRRIPTRSLDAEVAVADRHATRLLLIRPTAAEVRLHGINLMRAGDLAPLALAAYEATARRIESGQLERLLDAA